MRSNRRRLLAETVGVLKKPKHDLQALGLPHYLADLPASSETVLAPRATGPK
jgi:hypothetical protein